MQNSVFEGYLEDSKFKQLMKKLKKVINTTEDFIIIYALRSNNVLDRKIIGNPKKEYKFVV